MSTTVAEFSRIARALQDEARRLGLVAPAFRCPPHAKGANRTLRRTETGQVVVAVNRWRDEHAVASDMIEGLIRANDLATDEAEIMRPRLWLAAGMALAA